MACKIDRGSAFDCATLTQGGVKDYFYLINKEDFDANQLLTIDATSKEITALTLASGTQGYKFMAPKGSLHILPTGIQRKTNSLGGFDHSLDVRITDTSQLSIENLEKLQFQKVVAIVPLLNGKFKLYGRNVGLRMDVFEIMDADPDTAGTAHLVLAAPDDPPEVHNPIIISSDFDITTLDTPAA